MLRALVAGSLLWFATVASGDIVITEWMYSGGGDDGLGEYVEFTNTGSAAVDMTGWSFDDSSQTPGTVDLSAFGVVEAGESVILTEETAADFISVWGLTGVAVIGESSAGLGRNDEINLYDASEILVDRLTYGDEDFPGTVRTQTRSCNIPASDYGYAEAQINWVLAEENDAYGSTASTRGEIGSPGRIVGYALSDLDQDGDVDIADFDALGECLTGPEVSYDPAPTECGLTPNSEGFMGPDFDLDDDLDIADVSVFQTCFSGEGNPADPECGREFENPGATYIYLSGSYITVDGVGAAIDGTTATINSSGTYYVSGVLDDGQLVVDSSDGGLVQVVLNGASISNSTSAPVFVANAGSVEFVLADGTVNYLYDAETYVYEDPEEDEPNASLFSKDTMIISGTGALTVYGNYNDGITSKDELIITGGVFNVTAVDDGIRGKDYLQINDGDFTIIAGGDALKSDNDEDVELGYILIENGYFDITSGGDGIAAETDVEILNGDFTITCFGGADVALPEDLSAKGVKGGVNVIIGGGTFHLDCADDGVHSNDSITIDGGELTIASGDDAVHADLTLTINDGTINITQCYEGLESGGTISVIDGDITIVSDEDGITAETDVIISGGEFDVTCGGGAGAYIPEDFSAKGIKGLVNVIIDGGMFQLDCADDGVHSNDHISINGGELTIATGDDGVHSDETMEINGGTIIVTESYEGIESSDITINDGVIKVTSSDDGINGAGGVDGSGGPPGPPPGGDHYLYIYGGYIVVDADGDGIDVNGYIVMTGGTVLVHGPTGNMNGALDYDRTFNISGGLLIAAGSAGMAQAPSSTSSQRSVKITYSSWKSGGTLARIQTNGGADVATFAPFKNYQSLVVSSPDLQSGASYELYRGGSCTGTYADGLYTGGTYTPGTRTNTFTTYNTVTNLYAP